MQLRKGRSPGGPYLLVQQRQFQVFYLIFLRYHTVTWGPGQVTALSLSHRPPGAIETQQLKVLQVQILSPGFAVLPWGEKEGGISRRCLGLSKGPSF